jgi:hypothetical protein
MTNFVQRRWSDDGTEYVRYWPKADIGKCTANVRFWGKADMARRSRLQLRTTNLRFAFYIDNPGAVFPLGLCCGLFLWAERHRGYYLWARNASGREART